LGYFLYFAYREGFFLPTNMKCTRSGPYLLNPERRMGGTGRAGADIQPAQQSALLG
jgi:hypothetical protein